MHFNTHSDLRDKHSVLSPSKYHWINYDSDKLANYYRNLLMAARGTELHAFAANAIKLKQKLTANHTTLSMFVNDAIGYRMDPEVILYYSRNAFGTADAISFRRGTLRIHDLKTGVSPVHMQQLEVYAALFCLEYNVKPGSINIELRIYQNDEVIAENPEVDVIAHIMDRIITFDKLIETIREEEL